MSKKGKNFNTGKFGPKRPRSGTSASHSHNKQAQNNQNKNAHNHAKPKPLLIEFENLSQETKNSINKFLVTEQIEYPILGAVRSIDGYYNPVVHDLQSSLPILFRKLSKRDTKITSVDAIIEANTCYFSSLEHFELKKKITQDATYYVLKRTYVLNTLQDALHSSITIPLVEVLKTLSITIRKVEAAHAKGFVHGHIHPGNICFKQASTGHLLDAGFMNLYSGKIPNFTNSKATIAPELFEGDAASPQTDIYGLGYTLKSIFECDSIICSEGEPTREEVLAVLGPIIESAMYEDPGSRITLAAFSSIFFDLLPLFNVHEVPKSIVDEENTPEDVFFSNNHTKEEVQEDFIEQAESFDVTNFDSKEEHFNPRYNLELEKEETSYVPGEQFKQVFQHLNESAKENIADSQPNHKMRKLVSTVCFLILLFAIFILGSKFLSKIGLIQQAIDSVESTDDFSGHILTLEDLNSAWASGVLSQMKLVADQAVYKNPGRILAERVILSSVTNDQIKTELVDSSLLRVAFSPQWEEQLQEDDRRYALSLGLIQILKNQIPRDLGKLEERNPAIVLALMSSGSISVNKFLSQVPLSYLEKLPPPYGPAFQLISTASENKNCGDQEVITLARLGTRGVENPVTINTYLSEDFKRRVSALAILYTAQPDNARKVLDIVISHPNLALQNPEVMWARRVSLLDWNDVDPADKLFLLAGVPLRGNTNLGPESVAKLFLNPSARVRGYAAGLAVDKITFLHKAAPEILSMISKSPDILSKDQFVMLGQILEDPKKTAESHRKIVQSFIASNPSIDISKHLLLATSGEKESTILDSALTVYLGEKQWVPSNQELQLLLHHPDKVTRMMAYQFVYKSADTQNAKLLLEKALKNETDPEFKQQLKSMISNKN